MKWPSETSQAPKVLALISRKLDLLFIVLLSDVGNKSVNLFGQFPLARASKSQFQFYRSRCS